MQIADIWLRDLPQQFQGKHNIEVLIKAFSKQMQEVDKVFQELNTITDIETATGKNLDCVGTIIPLTRKEAGELAGINAFEPVIQDERYRQYLRYKMLQNTSECTYYEIMKSIEILWDVDRTHYYERDDSPATIFIGLPTVDVNEDDQAKGKPKILKPAGVGFFYTSQYSTNVDHSMLEKVLLQNLKIFSRFYFFAKLLNGGWNLDGFSGLNQIPICEVEMGVILGVIRAAQEIRAFCAFSASVVVPEKLLGNRCSMEIGCGFEANDFLNVECENVSINVSVCMGARVNVDEITMEKDLWRLDGQILMDGSRILDAEVWKERL